MASLNKVLLIGSLGADPEVRYLPSGDAVTNIRLATNEKFKDKQTGEQREATEWHRVAFFGKLAEIAGQYLKKGGQCYIEGSIKTRKYTDKDGAEKYSTEIKADVLKMLGSRQDGGERSAPAAPPARAPRPSAAPAPAPAPAPQDDFDDGEIPF